MKIHASAGEFAGNKDAAAHIRENYLKYELKKRHAVVLDFEDVGLATQSFIHALIAEVVREDPNALELIDFKNCNEEIQALIEIVVEYAQNQYE